MLVVVGVIAARGKLMWIIKAGDEIKHMRVKYTWTSNMEYIVDEERLVEQHYSACFVLS